MMGVPIKFPLYALGARHPCLFSKSIPALRPTFLLQPKKVGKKGRSLQKFLTAQKGLF
jgi:hypothetical protein